MTRQVLFIVGVREGEVSFLVVGSLGTMGSMLCIVKSLGTRPGDLAGHRFTRPEGLVQCESILAIVCHPVRMPGAGAAVYNAIRDSSKHANNDGFNRFFQFQQFCSYHLEDFDIFLSFFFILLSSEKKITASNILKDFFSLLCIGLASSK